MKRHFPKIMAASSVVCFLVSALLTVGALLWRIPPESAMTMFVVVAVFFWLGIIDGIFAAYTWDRRTADITIPDVQRPADASE